MLNPYPPNPADNRSAANGSDRHAWLTGVCGDLAAGLDLPVGAVRVVVIVFSVLPTFFTYFALALLAGQRRARVRYAAASFQSRPTNASYSPLGRDFAAVRERFAALEPRLSNVEAFVSSKDFELHKGFRHMRD